LLEKKLYSHERLRVASEAESQTTDHQTGISLDKS